MKKLFFLALVTLFMNVALKAQTSLYVKNNSACSVSVSLRAYDLGAPSGCGCDWIPTKSYVIPPSGSVTFGSGDLLSTPYGSWDFELANVNTPPLCGMPDGCGVDDPLIGTPTPGPQYGTSNGSFTVCSCGTVNVTFHAAGSPGGTDQVENLGDSE